VEGHHAVADLDLVRARRLGVPDALGLVDEAAREGDLHLDRSAVRQRVASDGEGREVELGPVDRVVDAEHLALHDRAEGAVVGLLHHLIERQALDLGGADRARGREGQGR